MPGSLLLTRSVTRRTPLLLLLAVLALALLTACGGKTAPATAPGVVEQGLAPASATTNLDTMTVAELPPEGIETLRLIMDGGPFPYSKDGSTFQNREGILPQQSKGFYAEYTVETPGSDDRGARRIIGGDDGSRFYTDDHYSSFREVVSGEGS
ncbi:ribonuclease domain-containing protein [Longivirga aurantiaca]|uniref:Ribonuclease domain-containing protein n=1 Tax=Longivirga aurantiaca TaxID=1837743 RepID=A0ABW1T228_9ACTN